MPLRSILGLNWGGEDGPGGGDYGATTEPCWCLGASWVPLGAKMAPRPLQDTSWDRFYRILGANLMDFWSQLGGFWVPT